MGRGFGLIIQWVFWIEAPALVAEMRRDSSCRPLVDKFEGVPVLFVSTASLMYLIASKK